MYPVTPNCKQFFGATDFQTIQNAVDYASAHDLSRVVIPRYIERTGDDMVALTAVLLER